MKNAFKTEEIDDLVFEHRNKAYGAYNLRKTQDEKSIKGLLVAVSIIGVMLWVVNVFAIDRSKDLIVDDIGNEVTLENTDPTPRPVEPIPPRQEQVVPSRPQVDQIELVPPKVVIDNVQVDEDLPPTQDEMQNKIVSNVTQEGDPNSSTGLVAGTGTGNTNSTIESSVSIDNVETKIYVTAQVNPSFDGGYEALHAFLRKTLRYPETAREVGIKGKVVVQFVVEPDGSISNVNVVKGIGGGCDQEALRAISKMPKWNPGMMNGRAVRVKFTLPFHFDLKD
jgi:periplasmic protein TonB